MRPRADVLHIAQPNISEKERVQIIELTKLLSNYF